MWTTLNFESRSKKEKETENIFKGTPDIEFEQDWLVGLGATLRDRGKILVSRICPWKADSIILLGFECTPTKFNQYRWSHFWENQNFKFFLMRTALNFGGNSKTERTGRRYLQGDSTYRIWTRLVSWLRCYFSWRKENEKLFF